MAFFSAYSDSQRITLPPLRNVVSQEALRGSPDYRKGESCSPSSTGAPQYQSRMVPSRQTSSTTSSPYSDQAPAFGSNSTNVFQHRRQTSNSPSPSFSPSPPPGYTYETMPYSHSTPAPILFAHDSKSSSYSPSAPLTSTGSGNQQKVRLTPAASMDEADALVYFPEPPTKDAPAPQPIMILGRPAVVKHLRERPSARNHPYRMVSGGSDSRRSSVVSRR